MTYMGIYRGDGRTPEQKAAAESIRVGGTPGGLYSFHCAECREHDWMPGFKHKLGCNTGKILEGK